MDSRRSALWFAALAPAKLNLFFEIRSRREDGYHEIETCVCPIRWYDRIWFRPVADGELRFSCRWVSSFPPDFPPGDLPDGASNLAYRALELLRNRTFFDRGAEVVLIKSIPSGSGLGGASSDAAAVLALANRGWRLHLSQRQLIELAAELGSDVPLFLVDGFSLCRGRGEQVRPIGCYPLNFVVVRPPAVLSTREMYQRVVPPGAPQSADLLMAALQTGNAYKVGQHLFNRFQEYAAEICPWVDLIRREFAKVGVLGHALTGSGTAYFGLCRSQAHAAWAAGVLRQRKLGLVWAGQSCRGIACWVEESSHGNHRGPYQACR
ncbi:MAG: 4-(cytidine 5'-diphospho)-2-C-methyl-D-erythritol kinase [Thermoguttaceae bacterium]|nr:4-(cytidine 5'-diphospho)-2-C-methyl-D-erythritol kinase [Thermoguttaceae bacterium]